MSRVDRCKEYANPRRRENWDGESTAENIARWSQRAAENSAVAPRARKGAIRLADTAAMDQRDTGAASRKDANVDLRARAKADENHLVDASPFMKAARRNA